MWPAPALATVVAIALAWTQPLVLILAGPFLVGWWLAPAIAWWVSQPIRPQVPVLTEEERRRLLCLARKTWGFFETYVGTDDNWIPPDNYQEDPKEVAHRTSPTNIGLYLLSAITAHDFGFISLPVLLDRLEKAFAALDRLERVNGHFLNWYDTQTLQPLQPRYISTVDSGNLLACLLTLEHALADKSAEAFALGPVVEGLRTAAELAAASFRKLEPPHHPTASHVIGRLEKAFADLERQLQATPANLVDLQGWLDRLERWRPT